MLCALFRPLPDRTSGLETESLIVEVWDFDPAETVVEKLSGLNNIKGMRGFRRLLKEIATSAVNQGNLNELIGSCEIVLTVNSGNSSVAFLCELKFYVFIV